MRHYTVLRLAWALCMFGLLAGIAFAAGPKTRVLFVGGDWQAQMPGRRGDFVRQAVEQAAPGKFTFTLWTTYEFLQYGDRNSLKAYDVIIAGDFKGENVLPRLADGLTEFVEGGGGFLYTDNHKAFLFTRKERSLDAVLPIEIVPFRPVTNEAQPFLTGKPVAVTVAAPDHPALKGLDWASAPALRGAHYGTVKLGATVLAQSAEGTPIWVAWEKGQGRACWLGGVMANNELSEDFAKWPQFGAFYAQMLGWLGEKSRYPQVTLKKAVARGTLTVDWANKGAEVSARHFSLLDYPGAAMTGKELDLYKALNLDGAFARGGYKYLIDTIHIPPFATYFKDAVEKANAAQPDRNQKDIPEPDTTKFDFTHEDAYLADIEQLSAIPYCMEDPGYAAQDWTARKWALATMVEHANGKADTPEYKTRIQYVDVHQLRYPQEDYATYIERFNDYAATMRTRAPGVKLGFGPAYQTEWPYVQEAIDGCGENLGWITRIPAGITGEAIFAAQDEYLAHAREKGVKNLQFLLAESEFWLYGAPSFDYFMTRFKATTDHADSTLGSFYYSWPEVSPDGYVFGLVGSTNDKLGDLPPEWPNPGKDKPITYRYNAYWIMRDCRGPQYPVKLDCPEIAASPSSHAFGVATCDGKKFNIVIDYGYAYQDLQKGREYQSLKIHVKVPIPAEVTGRTLTISRADCKQAVQEKSRRVHGNTLDLELDIPARSAVSLTVQ